MYALAIANQLEQEVTIERETIGAQDFECPDIECGAVFSYRRVSCGHSVQPAFCPTCGGPMGDAQEDGLMIVESRIGLAVNQRIPARLQRAIAAK